MLFVAATTPSCSRETIIRRECPDRSLKRFGRSGGSITCGSRPAGRPTTISPSRTSAARRRATARRAAGRSSPTTSSPASSATDDRRPEFQRMIDAATTKPPAFDVILVHSFSRFFRDQFQLEFYVRRLAKNGVRLVSITQELGDDPMSNMIRQIMALFDEYQSKENAKHTLRAMKENARQGFWNGALPPIGYRIVEAAEQRGHRTKKTLEIDPIQAETVRLIFRLAREGDGTSGPMGVKSIAKHLNAAGIRTRDGGRWGIGAVHKVLTRTTYVGRHRFNTKFWKTRERKPETEVVEMVVPPIVDAAEFEAVQTLLKTRSPAITAPRVVSGPTLLTGICFCAACGWR